MVHVGRRYPFYNPSRIIAAQISWPQYAATEYAWSVIGWTPDPDGALAASGRGLLPAIYTPGDRSILYTRHVGYYLGLSVDLIMTLGIADDGMTNVASWAQFHGANLCVSCAPNPFPGTDWGYTVSDRFGLVTITAYGSDVLHCNPLLAEPVDWTYDPFPPPSSPF